MASRIMHLAIAKCILESADVKDENRFRLGMILPDAYAQGLSTYDSHLKTNVCGGTKKTYNLTKFREMFSAKMLTDDLYLGYYLHLIQDLAYRHFVNDRYKWKPLIPEDVERLHNDYRMINRYVINKYRLKNDIVLPLHFAEEEINQIYPFAVSQLLADLEHDFAASCEGKIFFFTPEMAYEYIEKAVDICRKEMEALRRGRFFTDEFSGGWENPPKSLFETTQNTRELGGYKTKHGQVTKYNSLIRSDVPKYPNERDVNFLIENGITTIIDLRNENAVHKGKSGFADLQPFKYFHYPIEWGSDLPNSIKEIPNMYFRIACSEKMKNAFQTIARAENGVMFHCSAGKDRTGVLSAILLMFAGVCETDIVENYMATKTYGKVRLELVHKKFPEIDMRLVVPNESNMKGFLEMFYEKFTSAENYFSKIGLCAGDIEKIRKKLLP